MGSSSLRLSRLSLLLPQLALLLASAPARAQFSFYGTFSDDRVSNLVNGSTTGLNPVSTYGSYWDPGFGGGITVTVLPLGLASVALDLRGSATHGAPGDDTVFAGLKLGARIPVLRIKPYIQASGGYLRTRTPASVGVNPATLTQDFAAYEILGGIDRPLFGPLDLRLIEIGGGKGYQISGPNSSSPSLLTLGTGVVLHF